MRNLSTSESLGGAQIFLFTDNTTVEGCFYAGTSSSKVLFDLVLDLRYLEMTESFILFVIHISGTRMIQSGIDGLSRGDMDQGLMSGASPLEFVALHQSALERSPNLEAWLFSWMPNNSKSLTPEGWFSDGHGDGPYIWSPPPAAVDYALDQLCIARHKNPLVFHVVVVPRLFTSRWRKQLIKLSDYVFTFPFIFPLWDKSYHEPLILGLIYPLYPRYPWQFRRTKLVGDLDREMRGMLSGDLGGWGDILRKFSNPPPPLVPLS